MSAQTSVEPSQVSRVPSPDSSGSSHGSSQKEMSSSQLKYAAFANNNAKHKIARVMISKNIAMFGLNFDERTAAAC